MPHFRGIGLWLKQQSSEGAESGAREHHLRSCRRRLHLQDLPGQVGFGFIGFRV